MPRSCSEIAMDFIRQFLLENRQGPLCLPWPVMGGFVRKGTFKNDTMGCRYSEFPHPSIRGRSSTSYL